MTPRTQLQTLRAALAQPLRSEAGWDRWLIAVFVAINGLVLVNACLHDPRIGYDAGEHLRYIEALAQLRLVTPESSHEFFSPPLPYLLPALAISLTGMEVFWAAKVGQLLNVVLSVGLTFGLLAACRLISPHPSLRLGSLVFLGILPVYYKTFAFVRPEPWVVFFAVVLLHQMLSILSGRSFTLRRAAVLGCALGLCALSRQWGILLFPAVFASLGMHWLRTPGDIRRRAKALALCLLLAFLSGGWFYAVSKLRYGSTTAFNRESSSFSLFNQPRQFYTGAGRADLFAHPVRPSFPNWLFPTFYSEVWGDYWGYFVVYGIDTRSSSYIPGGWALSLVSEPAPPAWLETNAESVPGYLGRVNLVSLAPSAFYLAALAFAAGSLLTRRGGDVSGRRRQEMTGFLLLAVTASLGGYLWFLVKYPSLEKGDTIKATYMLQIFPFLAVLAGRLLERLEGRAPLLSRFTLGAAALVAAHNALAMVTHYSWHRLF